jgi:glyoxylase-like metal-dependent hydrolase (beta-lactamase superfamily II)
MGAPSVETLPELGITVISAWIFNCYVVHDGGEGRPLVIDPGLVRNADAVVAQLGPGDEARPWVVAATHAHSDHVGGVPHLAGRAPLRLHLPAVVRTWRDGERPPTPGPREVARIVPVLADQPFDAGSLLAMAKEASRAGYGNRGYRMPVEVTGWLADGEAVPGAPNWVALHTPGHTTDSTCYWCATTRTLLSGDAVLSVGRRPWFNPEYVDEVASATTEDRLRALDVEHLLPGHGRVCTGSDVLANALGHRERPSREPAGLRRLLRRHRRQD